MKWSCLSVLLFMAIFGRAQQYTEAGALRRAMLAANSDTADVFRFMLFVDKHASLLPKDTVVSYWQLIYDRSHALNYDRGTGTSALCLGDNARLLGKYTTSLKYLFEAESSFKRIHRTKQLATTYNIIGNTYVGLNDSNRQREYYMKCYSLELPNKYEQTGAFAAAGLGNYYMNVKNFRKRSAGMPQLPVY